MAAIAQLKIWIYIIHIQVYCCIPSLGQEAVVVKNGSRLCGTGAARASTPILQNKAYWEVKIQQSGIWSCGV